MARVDGVCRAGLIRLMVTAVAGVMIAGGAADVVAEPSKPCAGTSSYKGWNSLRLANNLVELQVVPEIGGRVIQYRLGDKEFMWVNPALAGKLPPVDTIRWFTVRRPG